MPRGWYSTFGVADVGRRLCLAASWVALSAGFLGLPLLVSCDSSTPRGFVGSGTLEAETVILSAEISGAVLRLNCDEGDRVNAGDTLVVLDTAKLRLQRDEAQAALALAAANVRQAEAALSAARDELANVERRAARVRRLEERGSATEQSRDDLTTQERVATQRLRGAEAAADAARAQQARARAALQLLERTVADGFIRAPQDATILLRFVREGEWVAAGRPLLELADLRRLWIKVYVPAEDLATTQLGRSARVYPEGLDGASVSGQVSWIAAEAEFTPKNVQTREARADLVFAVKLVIANADGRLKPGLPADVAWE